MEQTTYFCTTLGKNNPLHRPTMTYTEVDSSMIDLVGYDAKEQILEVRFINSGLTYRYFDVPKAEYEGLLALQQSVRASRIKAEKKVPVKPIASFQIFPKTHEEQELLKQLLERMDIPFEVIA